MENHWKNHGEQSGYWKSNAILFLQKKSHGHFFQVIILCTFHYSAHYFSAFFCDPPIKYDVKYMMQVNHGPIEEVLLLKC